MIFTFRDGYTIGIPAGNKITGLIHNHERPKTITLNYEDLQDLIFKDHNLLEYIIDLGNSLTG